MAPQTTIGLLLSRLNAGYDMDVLTGAHIGLTIDGIRIHDPTIADALVILIQEFQYRRILRLIRGAAADSQLEERP
jgi:hypothetical protein